MALSWDLANNRITYAQSDLAAREVFLDEHRSFVAHVAGNFCKRVLQWGRDDELSVAFIAFNEAINVYDSARGVPFLAFSRTVMRNRITDFLRKESRHKCESLDLVEDELPAQGELLAAWANYNQAQVETERAGELELYQQRLSGFGLDFNDLVSVSPKHRDTRENLIRAAGVLSADKDMKKALYKKKRIPLTELSLASGLHLKTLERGRKYIIAVAIILCESEEFLHLRSYLKIPEQGRESQWQK